MFNGWSKALGPRVEVVAVEILNRERFATLRQLVDEVFPFTDAKAPLLSNSYSFEREMPETKAASAIPYARRSRRAEL